MTFAACRATHIFGSLITTHGTAHGALRPQPKVRRVKDQPSIGPPIHLNDCKDAPLRTSTMDRSDPQGTEKLEGGAGWVWARRRPLDPDRSLPGGCESGDGGAMTEEECVAVAVGAWFGGVGSLLLMQSTRTIVSVQIVDDSVPDRYYRLAGPMDSLPILQFSQKVRV